MADDATGEPEFTLEEALSVRGRMRAALGMGAERFPVPALIGMLSDEIERMRAAGQGDEDVARLVAETTGKAIPAQAVAEHHAPPEARRGG